MRQKLTEFYIIAADSNTPIDWKTQKYQQKYRESGQYIYIYNLNLIDKSRKLYMTTEYSLTDNILDHKTRLNKFKWLRSYQVCCLTTVKLK